MSSADRSRRYRARQRRAEAVYAVPTPAEVVEALITSGRLTEAAALDRDAVEAELAAVLAEWARHWRE